MRTRCRGFRQNRLKSGCATLGDSHARGVKFRVNEVEGTYIAAKIMALISYAVARFS